MRDELFREILMARRRVYAIADPTPLETLELDVGAEVFVKREDLSPIHAYKWRGAYNRMAVLSEEERDRGVVAASAGNHAQGVALAAKKLGVRARIFMPLSTPKMKQAETRRHGGGVSEIVLHGDTYDEAAERARAAAEEEGLAFIHPYDDLITMGGQGTLADEAVMSGRGPFDVVYVQIGGGGLAASVACWLKGYYPEIRVVGVEGVGQASMAAAMKAGEPVRLEELDVFCDGTAVRKVGELTYPLCRDLVDELITVTNDEVCAAIQTLWEKKRCVPEPAGAMGLAGLVKQREQVRGRRVLVLLCGANMDFGQLAWIARHADIGAARRRYYRFEISEHQGSMLELLETALEGLNIVEFQYGKTDPMKAWPVIGFEASAPELEVLRKRMETLRIRHEDVTSQEDVDFRLIHYEATLFHLPYFIKLEFPERAGALHDFLVRIKGIANICYFNYAYSGERVGRALMGFEFERLEQQVRFKQVLKKSGWTYREISEAVRKRIL
jgi:threonine dehydratase